MKLILVTILSMPLFLPMNVHAKSYCGDLRNSIGPYDYRKRDEHANDFYLVEMAHFTEDVENLVKGNTGTVGGDLDYTLRAIPNHLRALTAVAKLGLRQKSGAIPGLKWSVECYFDRALRFRPDDPGVRSLYGTYLYKRGRNEDAIKELSEAVAMDPENGTANHNLGLIYFQLKDYEKAAALLRKADELGFPQPSVKGKLIELGKWGAAAK